MNDFLKASASTASSLLLISEFTFFLFSPQRSDQLKTVEKSHSKDDAVLVKPQGRQRAMLSRISLSNWGKMVPCRIMNTINSHFCHFWNFIFENPRWNVFPGPVCTPPSPSSLACYYLCRRSLSGFWWSWAQLARAVSGHCFCRGGQKRNGGFRAYRLDVCLLWFPMILCWCSMFDSWFWCFLYGVSGDILMLKWCVDVWKRCGCQLLLLFWLSIEPQTMFLRLLCFFIAYIYLGHSDFEVCFGFVSLLFWYYFFALGFLLSLCCCL